MVNEMNKPPSQDNVILGERLAASNRQLQEMQEEHRQLLQEMEMLRRRAAELTRLNSQYSDNNSDSPSIAHAVDDNSLQNSNEMPSTSAASSTEHDSALEPAPEVPLPQNETEEASSSTQTVAEASKPTENVEKETDDEDPAEAEYLQKKLSEISALRTQYNRVQQMIDTTKLIEQHLDTRNTNASTTTAPQESPASGAATVSSAITAPVTVSERETSHNVDSTNAHTSTASPNPSTNPTHRPGQEELLSTMMNMFTDFTSDLRSQAADLRAERDRIRALKEELVRRKSQK